MTAQMVLCCGQVWKVISRSRGIGDTCFAEPLHTDEGEQQLAAYKALFFASA